LLKGIENTPIFCDLKGKYSFLLIVVYSRNALNCGTTFRSFSQTCRRDCTRKLGLSVYTYRFNESSCPSAKGRAGFCGNKATTYSDDRSIYSAKNTFRRNYYTHDPAPTTSNMMRILFIDSPPLICQITLFLPSEKGTLVSFAQMNALALTARTRVTKDDAV